MIHLLAILKIKKTNKVNTPTLKKKQAVIHQTTAFLTANGNQWNEPCHLEIHNSQIFNCKPVTLISWFQWHILVSETSQTAQQLQWPRRKQKERKRTPFHCNAISAVGYLQNSYVNRTSKQVLIFQVEAASRGNSVEQSMVIREGIVSAPGSQQSVAVSGVKWSCFKVDWAVTWTWHIPAPSERGSMIVFAGFQSSPWLMKADLKACHGASGQPAAWH